MLQPKDLRQWRPVGTERRKVRWGSEREVPSLSLLLQKIDVIEVNRRWPAKCLRVKELRAEAEKKVEEAREVARRTTIGLTVPDWTSGKHGKKHSAE